MTKDPQPDSATAERWLEMDGQRVRFLRAGKGPALVLVHGLLGYSFSWRHAIPILAGERDVIAVDMPGAGLSNCTSLLDGHLMAAARRLGRFLDALGISGCDLAGSSYGGTTALRLATIAPERIRTLVLASPANPWSRTGRKRLAVLNLPGIGWIFPKLARKFRPLHRYFVYRMYGDPSRVTSETLEGYSAPLLRPRVFEHAVKITRSWREDMHELEVELAKAREIPTLIVWGSKDRLVRLGSLERLSRNFREVKTIVQPGVGHLPYEEAPEEFCRPVLEFLATYSPVASQNGK